MLENTELEWKNYFIIIMFLNIIWKDRWKDERFHQRIGIFQKGSVLNGYFIIKKILTLRIY